MSKKLKIAIDLDSTLSGSSFLDETLRIYNDLYNDNVVYKDIKEWDLSKSLTKCTIQQIYDIWTPEFILSLDPDPHAKDLINILITQGHEVVIVTAYSSEHCVAKTEWCKEHLGVDEDNIIFCRKKYLIDCDILIDDRLRNFLDKDGLPCKFDKIVYSQPYNTNGNGLDWHYRIYNLGEAYKIIDRISKK